MKDLSKRVFPALKQYQDEHLENRRLVMNFSFIQLKIVLKMAQSTKQHIGHLGKTFFSD